MLFRCSFSVFGVLNAEHDIFSLEILETGGMQLLMYFVILGLEKGWTQLHVFACSTGA